jgi:DNA primase
MSAEQNGRVGEILDRAAAFYESFLWESEVARAVRMFLIERHDVSEEILREFEVGYSPFGWFSLQEHMSRWQYSATELHDAGVIQESRQGHRHYDRFRSRIMFPVRDSSGRPLGFAGLALHFGPSWPKWLTSPESERYQKRSAIFAIDRAAEAISEAGQAVVLSDCLDVLRLHQEGRREAVAVIRSGITPEHREKLEAYAPRIVRRP